MIVPKNYEAKVVEIIDLAPDIRHLKLSIKNFKFEPGQFINIKIPANKPLIRAYSICSKPNNDYIEICFKKVKDGPGTSFLFSLKLNDKINIFR